MFPRRNSKRFFDYESSSNLVSESVVTTTSVNPTVQSSTLSTSTITTTTTTTSVHPTSTTVSILSLQKKFFFNFWTILFIICDLGKDVY